jgi:hypothetical protein
LLAHHHHHHHHHHYHHLHHHNNFRLGKTEATQKNTEQQFLMQYSGGEGLRVGICGPTNMHPSAHDSR